MRQTQTARRGRGGGRKGGGGKGGGGKGKSKGDFVADELRRRGVARGTAQWIDFVGSERLREL